MKPINLDRAIRLELNDYDPLSSLFDVDSSRVGLKDGLYHLFDGSAVKGVWANIEGFDEPTPFTLKGRKIIDGEVTAWYLRDDTETIRLTLWTD